MRYAAIILCSLFILGFRSGREIRDDAERQVEKREYELIEMDSYGFRRAYYTEEELEGEALDVFMNRNPEPYEEYANSAEHPLYDQLTRAGIFQAGKLNIRDLDTLPDPFDFQAAPDMRFKVERRYLDDPSKVSTPSFEFTFTDSDRIVCVDTLEFGWLPDVTFVKFDLEQNGSEVLVSIYRWYIGNGDNFDLKIYELKKSR